ncbi:MAG: hypothetical protein P8Y60_15070, partial [Calditrichota bacterium]
RQEAEELAFGKDAPPEGNTLLTAGEPDASFSGTKETPEVTPQRTRKYTESWYTYWALGSAGLGYPDQLQQLLDTAENQPGVSRSKFSLDIFGFYWNVAPRTILGFIINAASDKLSYQSESISINQYLYDLSTIHFTGKRFGKGFFLRGDLGIASIAVEDPSGALTRSKAGGGFLLGAGWAIDFGGTRLMLGTNLALRRVEQHSYSVFDFSLGGLF